ncbi:hypothetical protein QR98_0023350 [Sarcoptes scabiei]|uniref:Uncharacterized protein n=1 Tax=Sarcoptes scabiei TaxID=52283 RepID=A0A131ZYM1_SARSC|nr:hypothetical protein QR98_0023350 [Sarcoptes scabiei]
MALETRASPNIYCSETFDSQSINTVGNSDPNRDLPLSASSPNNSSSSPSNNTSNNHFSNSLSSNNNGNGDRFQPKRQSSPNHQSQPQPPQPSGPSEMFMDDSGSLLASVESALRHFAYKY